ncbi:hypothetical protein DMJ13_16090 [halophilic archaeon]|nr:hypothetical protein DMJ13_16090 [halophilic archaeon]
MDTLGDLVARERRSDDPALLVPGDSAREFDYHRFCTTAWKTGNYLRRLGVRASEERPSDDAADPSGATVAIVPARAPEAVLALLGTALLGARVRFAPPRDVPARVLVAPGDRIGEYDLPPGGQRIAFREEADDPAVSWFGESVWSENPAFPPTPVSPGAPALTDGDRDHSHAALLAAAETVAEEWNLEPGDAVAVRASLADPRAVVAGVLAPLLAGAAILLPDGRSTGAFAVVADGDDAPEDDALSPTEVAL